MYLQQQMQKTTGRVQKKREVRRAVYVAMSDVDAACAYTAYVLKISAKPGGRRRCGPCHSISLSQAQGPDDALHRDAPPRPSLSTFATQPDVFQSLVSTMQTHRNSHHARWHAMDRNVPI